MVVSNELAREADEAICRVFGSDEHDDAMAALEEVMRVKNSGGNSLEVLQALAATSAIFKWKALHDKFENTEEMIGQGLLGGVRADGSEHDAMQRFSGGVISRFRLTPARGPAGRYPADVAACLSDCARDVVKWLKDEQRRCGEEAPLIKHDRFVRLCHQAVYGDEPPAHVLAIDAQQSPRQQTRGAA